MIKLNDTQICRYVLGLSWIYHGLFPKLLSIATIERQMTAALGFSPETSTLITRSAGVSEIIFGLLLLVFYQSKQLLILNIAALLGLCLFVAVYIPSLLIEGFNPVTTNFALIAISLVLINRVNHMH